MFASLQTFHAGIRLQCGEMFHKCVKYLHFPSLLLCSGTSQEHRGRFIGWAFAQSVFAVGATLADVINPSTSGSNSNSDETKGISNEKDLHGSDNRHLPRRHRRRFR